MKLIIGCAPDGFINYKNYEISINTKDVKPCLQNIIKDIYIENSPEEQQDLLLSKEFKSELEVKNFLKKYATKIKVKFHPLNIKREIKQEIKLADVEI